MQLLVLGMHRTGSSAVTRIINLMGVSIGPEDALMSPKQENPKGFWERRDVRHINDRLLQSGGASWIDVGSFDVRALPEDAIDRAAADAQPIITELDDERPWVLKDPRFCLLLPVWRRWLETPACVLVHRSPLQIAHSLKERNGLPVSVGVAVWERYVLEALRDSRDLPRVLVSYQDLIADPPAAALELYRRLRELGVSELREPDRAEVEGFVSSDLHRQRQTNDLEQATLNQAQRSLARAMEDGSALSGDDVPVLSVGARDVLQLYRNGLAAQRELTELRPARKLAAALREQSEGTGSSHRTAEELRRERDAVRAELRLLGWRHQALFTRFREAVAGRDELVDDLADELRGILNSRRWRTAMGAVRAANALRGRREGDPVEAHVNRHLRRHGYPVSAQDNTTAATPVARRWKELESYRGLVLKPPGKRGDIKTLPEKRVERLRATLLQCSQEMLVTVVMPTWNRATRLPTAIDTVRRQTYENWELIVIDDGSDDDTERLVCRLAEDDRRVRYLRIPHTGVSAARNEGLRAAAGRIIAYLDSDNRWHPDYLLFTVNAIVESARGCAYSVQEVVDHDRGGEVHRRGRVFDESALLRNNYIDINAFAHRAELVEELGGFDEKLARWVDWDLILRFVRHYPPAQIPITLSHYSRETKLLQISNEQPWAYKFKVLNKHLVDWSKLCNEQHRRVPGLVSIVIPVYGQVELTRRCLQSIYDYTRRGSFEVILVNNGSPVEDRAEISELAAAYESCTLLDCCENYMFALGNNLGVAASRGELVVLLNNDTEVLPGWLDGLIAPLQTNDLVGVVGPKLLYPDDTLQCGGMVFNDRSPIPYHIYRGLGRHHPAVCKPRHFQVVTGACMAMRADDFVRLGGLDPLFVNGGEDVDFCLRMHRELGKLVYYNPRAEIYHLEGRSPGRGRFISYNRRLLVDRWGDTVVPDDLTYYQEDGFEIVRYEKPGAEAHGETAAYVPVLKESNTGESPRAGRQKPRKAGGAERLLNVGFSTIWHARGISFHTKQLADALESPNLRTHVLARWESDKFTNSGPIHHPRVFDAGDDPSPDTAVEWARSNRLDLMIFMEVHPNDWKRVDALRKAGVRVMCYENLDVLRVGDWDRYELFDYFLFNTFYTRSVMLGMFPQKPSLTVPWGVSAPLPTREGDRENDRPVRFVHVAGWGGINNRKNTDLLIRAFDRAELGSAELHLYTQTPITSYGDGCARIARENSNLQVHEGTIDNIFDAYRQADMLLWPSKREGLGLPIVEALASGVPALVTDGYMMKQWIIANVHGVLCPATPRTSTRYLPQMHVDQDRLSELLSTVADDAAALARMKHRVRADNHLWSWSWQPDVLRDQIRKIAEDPAYAPPEDLAYLPPFVVEFERARRSALDEETT